MNKTASEKGITPLPWKKTKCGGNRTEHYQLTAQVDGEEVLIAIIRHDGQEWAEFEANAAYIVTACNSYQQMREALQAALECEISRGPSGSKQLCDACRQKVQAALSDGAK